MDLNEVVPFDPERLKYLVGTITPVPNVLSRLKRLGPLRVMLGDLDGQLVVGDVLASGELVPAIEIFHCDRRWFPTAFRMFSPWDDHRWLTIREHGLIPALVDISRHSGMPLSIMDNPPPVESVMPKRIGYDAKGWVLSTDGPIHYVAFDKETKTWAVWEETGR